MVWGLLKAEDPPGEICSTQVLEQGGGALVFGGAGDLEPNKRPVVV